MPGYRLYTLGQLGHFEGASEIVAEDDAAAIAAVIQQKLATRKELWCGPRMVREWGTADADHQNSSMKPLLAPKEVDP